MATPDIEMSLLLSQIDQSIQQIAQTIVNEIVRGRQSGVPDSVIAQTIVNLSKIPTSDLSKIAGSIAENQTKTMRKIYGQTEARLSVGLDVGSVTEIGLILPQNLGFLPEPNDIIRLGGNNKYLQEAQARIEQQTREAKSVRQQEIENETDNQMLMWQAVFINTCPSCITLSGQIKTLKQWKLSGGLPRQRETFCDGHCKCSLVPISVLKNMHGLSGSDISVAQQLRELHKDGIQVQRRKIGKLEKIRGEKYATSTQKQLLGQANNPKFSSTDKSITEKSNEKIPKNFGSKYWKNNSKYKDFLERQKAKRKK